MKNIFNRKIYLIQKCLYRYLIKNTYIYTEVKTDLIKYLELI